MVIMQPIKTSLEVQNIVKTVVDPQLQDLPPIPENIQMRVALNLDLIKQETDPDEIQKRKAFVFNFSTFHLYSELATLCPERTIAVVGYVLPDGFGDYYHIVNAAKTIRENCPNLKVRIVVCHVDENLPNVIRKPADIALYFFRFIDLDSITDMKECIRVYDSISPSIQEAKKLIAEADLVLEISQAIQRNRYYNDISGSGLDGYTYIAEYEASYYPPTAFAMGIASNHLGIVVKHKPATTSLLNLQNEPLKNILFGTEHPSEKDLENYLNTHEPVFGYLKWRSYCGLAFIYTTAACLKSSQKTIDLIIPPIKINCISTDFLKEQGISKLVIIKKENGNWIPEEHIFSNTGKTLRLISPFPLDQEDFFTLTLHSHPWIGCTGDLSWSEVVSFDRLPFYEMIKVKQKFCSRLCELADYVDPTKLLRKYFELLMEISSEKDFNASNESVKEETQNKLTQQALILAQLLQQPELYHSARKLNELLRTHHSFHPVLINLVKKELAFHCHSDLCSMRSAIFYPYVRGDISLVEAHRQLSEKIQEFVGSLHLRN